MSERNGHRGVQFAVWAPNAEHVSVIGDFNHWKSSANVMRPSSLVSGKLSFQILAREPFINITWNPRPTYVVDKADPYGFAAEIDLAPLRGVGPARLFMV